LHHALPHHNPLTLVGVRAAANIGRVTRPWGATPWSRCAKTVGRLLRRAWISCWYRIDPIDAFERSPSNGNRREANVTAASMPRTRGTEATLCPNCLVQNGGGSEPDTPRCWHDKTADTWRGWRLTMPGFSLTIR
jgi:hypothetical protein